MSRNTPGGALSIVPKIVSWALFHHVSDESRVESSTIASGKAAAISGQNAEAGQSTAAA